MQPDRKVYSARAMRIGAFLGGPLAAMYLMAENFKVLGQPDKVAKTWLTGGFLILVLLGFLLSLPEEIINKIPNLLFSTLTMLATHIFIARYQQEDIRQFLNQEGRTYSAARVAVIIVLMMLITLAFAFALAFGLDHLGEWLAEE